MKRNKATQPEKEEARPISIWQPRSMEGETIFVRPGPRPFGDHYADRLTFSAKKPTGRTRICFFGESAAAGYLYAPHATPAKMLEHLLAEICGKPQFEVIDLARTNETLDGLVATVESALQLQPDALIVFTGNNWTMLETPELSPYFPSAEARLDLARLLREEGMSGVIGAAARRVLEKAAAAFARIERAARAVAAPVVVVVPEVNLADWENRQAPLWLPGNGTAQWHAGYQKATEALRNADWQSAIATAWRLEDLDACCCPTTYRVLARAFSGQGETGKAREACQAEVDSNRYPTLSFLGAPQINSGFRNLQKKAAALHGFSLVDLAEIFARHTGCPLPGRRMFLDYCHLTLEGMKVAMTAVAVAVLRKTDCPGGNSSWETLVEQLPYPAITPEADATAKFGAAIHTAHRHLAVGAGTGMLDYWCREALDAAPGIRQAMLDFLAIRLAPLPAVLTAAQQQNFASPYRLLMQHGIHYDYLDAPLLQVIAGILGMESALEWPGQDKIDLVHPPYFLWEPVERFYPEVMRFQDIPGRAFYRAAWPESNFALFCPPGRALRLEPTLRLPRIPGWAGKREGTVILKLNGQAIGVLPVGETWTKASFSIPQLPRTPALRQLTLVWPELPPCGDEAIAGAIHRLEQGREADLHPVFGEVFALKVWPAP